MSGSAGVRDATEPTDGRQSWRLSFHRQHKQGRPSEQQRASIGDPQARKELVCAHAKRSQVKLCQEPCLLPVNRINHAGQGESNVALLRLKTSSLRQKQSRLNTLCHWTLWRPLRPARPDCAKHMDDTAERHYTEECQQAHVQGAVRNQ